MSVEQLLLLESDGYSVPWNSGVARIAEVHAKVASRFSKGVPEYVDVARQALLNSKTSKTITMSKLTNLNDERGKQVLSEEQARAVVETIR